MLGHDSIYNGLSGTMQLLIHAINVNVCLLDIILKPSDGHT